jgi:hypothetical protein
MNSYMGAGVAIGICWGTALGIVQDSPLRLDPGKVLWLVIGVAVGIALGRRMNGRNRK